MKKFLMLAVIFFNATAFAGNGTGTYYFYSTSVNIRIPAKITAFSGGQVCGEVAGELYYTGYPNSSFLQGNYGTMSGSNLCPHNLVDKLEFSAADQVMTVTTNNDGIPMSCPATVSARAQGGQVYLSNLSGVGCS
ncbi:MAG: hypothetical protein QM752_06425 [Gammaproteobacteria bacterium]